jgi:2-haloacid dehalogenase
LFTLFDPRSVVSVAEQVVGAPAPRLCEIWRSKQFEYAFLRAAAGQYEDFRSVTDKALVFAARTCGVELRAADRARLVRAYSELAPWPDTAQRLEEFRAMGLRLAPLANYAPSMLAPLLENAGVAAFFETQISTDLARVYKPDPAAYALGPARLGLTREEIVFAAFGGWDAAGAKWFGYPTFWVNRLGLTAEELAPGPDASGPTLAELRAFVQARHRPR